MLVAFTPPLCLFLSLQRVLKNPRAKGLDIAGFIIKPTQRLALYPLLVGDILKATEPGLCPVPSPLTPVPVRGTQHSL